MEDQQLAAEEKAKKQQKQEALATEWEGFSEEEPDKTSLPANELQEPILMTSTSADPPQSKPPPANEPQGPIPAHEASLPVNEPTGPIPATFTSTDPAHEVSSPTIEPTEPILTMITQSGRTIHPTK